MSIPPFKAVLFPFFSASIGVVVLFLLDRFNITVPYTALMFVFGMALGLIFGLTSLDGELSQSVDLWTSIDSETLLLVFLPGLLFGDALNVNYHMFKRAFLQNLILAFPGVLAGTGMTALVVYYVFPYNWPLSLALTIGSILSATDPVSIASLLDEMGAPPRLAIHVTGESMLNDGSAIVFFTLFSSIYLSEFNIPGVGEEYNGASGTALFFKMSIGGSLIGLSFGIILTFFLWLTNRKVADVDNLLQISLTIVTAYLSYYVAEVMAGTSGVLAVVFCGVFTSRFGVPLVDNRKFLEHVWVTIEFFGNTILFMLAGTIWGFVVSDRNLQDNGITITWSDWGYLIVLFLFLVLIRIVVVLMFYPLNCRIGLNTNLSESTFIIWGGLRGAVAIALALSLDNDVSEHLPESIVGARQQSAIMFMMVGGISLMTLCINGTSAKVVLQRLKLGTNKTIADGLLVAIKAHIKVELLDLLRDLMTRKHFSEVSFDIVKYHISLFADISNFELDSTHQDSDLISSHARIAKEIRSLRRQNSQGSTSSNALKSLLAKQRSIRHELTPEGDLKAMREIFIHLLYSAYDHMLETGELQANSFTSYSLLQSLDFAAESVTGGQPLNDFTQSALVSDVAELKFERFIVDMLQKCSSKTNVRQHQVERTSCAKALVFIEAHRLATKYFIEEFGDNVKMGSSSSKVVEESKAQQSIAESLLLGVSQDHRVVNVSHIASTILLTRYSRRVARMAEELTIDKKYAAKLLRELQSQLDTVSRCHQSFHLENENVQQVAHV